MPLRCLTGVITGHFTTSGGCPLYPQKRTSELSREMSALCQKRTFRLLLDIIVGGQGCSSSWSITRETSPPAISAPGRGRCCAAGPVAECSAQTYPTRSVRLIVGFPAGNASDIFARLIAQSLSERLGQQFVVENRPGAGGNVGTEVVVRASPDGYTLLIVLTSNAINATLYANLNFDFRR